MSWSPNTPHKLNYNHNHQLGPWVYHQILSLSQNVDLDNAKEHFNVESSDTDGQIYNILHASLIKVAWGTVDKL